MALCFRSRASCADCFYCVPFGKTKEIWILKQIDYSFKNGGVKRGIEIGERFVGEKFDNKSGEKSAEKNLFEKKSEENAAAVLLLDRILIDAREKQATDIHIENNMVRFRMKGKLEVQMELEKERCEELVQRIKLLSDMNVLEKRRSQDGSQPGRNRHKQSQHHPAL